MTPQQNSAAQGRIFRCDHRLAGGVHTQPSSTAYRTGSSRCVCVDKSRSSPAPFSKPALACAVYVLLMRCASAAHASNRHAPQQSTCCLLSRKLTAKLSHVVACAGHPVGSVAYFPRAVQSAWYLVLFINPQFPCAMIPG